MSNCFRNVSYDTTEEQLTTTFSEFGTVVMCKIVKDFGNGRSRGVFYISDVWGVFWFLVSTFLTSFIVLFSPEMLTFFLAIFFK